jgi:hypothetical protein
MLPDMASEDGYTLLNALANSSDDQLSIFETDVVQDLIQYKWRTFASRAHWFSGLVYLVYVIALAFYVNDIYLKDEVFFNGVRLNPEANTDAIIL